MLGAGLDEDGGCPRSRGLALLLPRGRRCLRGRCRARRPHAAAAGQAPVPPGCRPRPRGPADSWTISYPPPAPLSRSLTAPTSNACILRTYFTRIVRRRRLSSPTVFIESAQG